MKTIQNLVFFILTIHIGQAEINTENAQGIFHVDNTKNTSILRVSLAVDCNNLIKKVFVKDSQNYFSG